MRSVRGSRKAWQNARAKKKPRRKAMKCYTQRGEKLSSLGYVGYQAYLASEDWRKVRENKLRRYPNCLLCRQPATQVHHLSYDYRTLLGMDDIRLVQLCRECHKGIEFDGERKRSLREANAELFRLAGQVERGRRWIARMETTKRK